MADFEIIQTSDETTVIVIEDAPAEVISEGVLGPAGPPGPMGPQGPAGESGSIGGFLVEVASPSQSDLLQFSANSKWVNSSLVDGGNF